VIARLAAQHGGIPDEHTTRAQDGTRYRRADLPKIDVLVLVVHGTDDRILPFEATAARLPGLIDDVKLVAVEGGRHNIAWTHPDEVNEALLEFIGAPTPVAA
jgi:pimeloyl-ACP methyl ester carboxylesterase